MLQLVKEKVINFFYHLHLYDLALLATMLMLALCFIFLSFIAFRRKLISIPLFFIGFGIVIALPFAMRYIMENRFYMVDTEVLYDKVLRYSDVYKYDATLTNVGKRNIAGCLISHEILYDTNDKSMIDKYKHMILNYVKPKKVYVKDIPMDLKVNQSITISMQSQEFMPEYPHRDENYVTKVQCYGKRIPNGVEPIQGKYLKVADKGEEDSMEEVEGGEDSTPSEASKPGDSKVDKALARAIEEVRLDDEKAKAAMKESKNKPEVKLDSKEESEPTMTIPTPEPLPPESNLPWPSNQYEEQIAPPPPPQIPKEDEVTHESMERMKLLKENPR